MKPLDLQSEKYAATGNVASEGVLNQLGRPNLDVLNVLVRESVQNSWDARAEENATIDFGVQGWDLSDEQLDTLTSVIFRESPPSIGLAAALEAAQKPKKGDSRERTAFRVLAVYDRGTVGLGGPTRADIVGSDEEEPRNFVDFLRNVGQPPDRRLGGGTYGYGKAALYLASEVHTLCVHTHCTDDGEPKNRFIGSALGPRYQESRKRTSSLYTGRHWWGRLEDDGVVEPETGKSADSLAQKIGMPDFGDDARGTTLLILQPTFGERTAEQSMRFIATSILWSFWPKMLPRDDGSVPMRFSVSWNGEAVPVPDPRAWPPLKGFVEAMTELKRVRKSNGASESVRAIVCERPKRALGLLSLSRFPYEPRAGMDVGTDSSGLTPIEGASHHVALMRQAELVVRYLPGPALPSDAFEYAGVFIADPEADAAYANAEPPTHDDWSYHLLEDQTEKTLVRVGLRRVAEVLKEFAAPRKPEASSGLQVPLAAFAERLGDLLPGEEGPGARIQPLSGPAAPPPPSAGPAPTTSAGSTGPVEHGTVSGEGQRDDVPSGTGSTRSRSSRARIVVQNEGSLGLVDDQPALIVEFQVQHAAGTRATRVVAEPGVVLDSEEVESDPPLGSARAEVLFWEDPAGVRHQGTVLDVPVVPAGSWKIAVSVPGDAIVSIGLRVERSS